MQFESTIHKAIIGAQPLDGELAALREGLSAQISDKRAGFEASIAEVSALREALPILDDTVLPSADDLLIAVKAEILNQREKVIAAKAIEHGFRVRHGRLELPKSPNAALSTLKCATGWLAETIGNTGFLVTAHLAAGLPQALGISALASGTNVIACGLGGYFIGRYREWGSKAPDADAPEFTRRRWVAHTQFGAFVAAIGFLHLTMGAIRSQETLSDIEHSVSAYLNAFGDPQSFLLMLAGLCMSCFTFHEGKHGFGHRYPEYSDHHRSVEESIVEIEDIYDSGKEQINNRFNAVIKDLDENMQRIVEVYQNYNAAVGRSHSAYRELKSAVDEGEMHLRTEVANLITIYQSAKKAPQQPFSPNDLDAMCSLPEFETIGLPAYIHSPQSSQQNNVITRARDSALAELSDHYAGAIS